MKFEIVHTCIRIKDLEKSLKFYQHALGMKEVKRKDFPEDGFTLVFLGDENGNHELELTYNYDRDTAYELGDGYSHLAMVVDDLEGAHSFHEEAGYPVTPIKGLSDGPPKIYFITDPDGYKIEIIRK
ncbi:VOC family protein [Alkalibacter rhizosphaerae]|uniref:Aldoketomutase n=1 Tax=Alkalibacter rhizosphaerae TaxID=2815577 RepID=A0A974XEG4_9FIRM|nr:VOC family protein [Alkalibacter rhizosphaerae]QSX08323.1 VOC family protein [Alkalibacter rhizosphaerae]